MTNPINQKTQVKRSSKRKSNETNRYNAQVDTVEPDEMFGIPNHLPRNNSINTRANEVKMVRIVPQNVPKVNNNTIRLKGTPLKTQAVWGKNIISNSFMPTQLTTQFNFQNALNSHLGQGIGSINQIEDENTVQNECQEEDFKQNDQIVSPEDMYIGSFMAKGETLIN